MQKLKWPTALLPLGALVLLGACDQSRVDSATTVRQTEAVGAKSGAGVKDKSGFLLWESPRPVAALTFQGGEGQPLSVDAFRGKVAVLNLWATWCAPCREEMPTLDGLQAKLGGADLEVLALSIDHGGTKVIRQFFREIGVKYLRLYIDPSGQALNALNILGIPTTLLIDRRGRELGRLTGIAKWDSPEMVNFLQGVIDQTKGDRS